jgi:hypothetical protein
MYTYLNIKGKWEFVIASRKFLFYLLVYRCWVNSHFAISWNISGHITPGQYKKCHRVHYFSFLFVNSSDHILNHTTKFPFKGQTTLIPTSFIVCSAETAVTYEAISHTLSSNLWLKRGITGSSLSHPLPRVGLRCKIPHVERKWRMENVSWYYISYTHIYIILIIKYNHSNKTNILICLEIMTQGFGFLWLV